MKIQTFLQAMSEVQQAPDGQAEAHRQWKHFHAGSSSASSTFSPYRMNRQSPQKTPCARTMRSGQGQGQAGCEGAL